MIHQKGYLILCLNDYRRDGDFYTFVAIQDKHGHGYHAEGRTEALSETLETLVSLTEKPEGK